MPVVLFGIILMLLLSLLVFSYAEEIMLLFWTCSVIMLLSIGWIGYASTLSYDVKYDVVLPIQTLKTNDGSTIQVVCYNVDGNSPKIINLNTQFNRTINTERVRVIVESDFCGGILWLHNTTKVELEE
jgi:hypothetical protein